MAGPIRIAILANAAQAKKEFSSTADAANGMGSKISSAGKKLAVGVVAGTALAGAAALKFGSAAVKSASDAQQSIGATETVFGKYANSVIANSNRAAKSVGLSANEYRELANVMGASLSGAGIPLKKTATLTEDINKRAADMAATFGGTTRNAVEAIGSLMRGEADPIEAYGVSIKQTDVNARLAAQGQDKLTGAALKQAEMQARLDLLMQKTAKTQGAFGRESGTLAHQQQVLGAQFENIKAKVGSALLPVLTNFLTYLNSSLIPAVKNMLPGLREWAAEMGERLAPIVTRVSTFVTGTLVPAITRFAGYVTGTVVPAVQQLVAKVAANLAPVLTALVGHAQRVAAKLREWQPTIQQNVTAIAKIVGKVLEFASAILGKVLPPAIRFASFLSVTLAGAIITAVSVVVKIIAKVIEFGGAVVDGARKVGEFAGKVRDKIADVVGFFEGLPGKIKTALGDGKDMLVGIGKNIVEGLGNGIEAMREWIRQKIENLSGWIPGWIKRRLGISSPSKVTYELGRWTGQGLADGITSMRGKVSDAADKTAQKITDSIKRRLESAKGVRDAITSLRDSISSALTGDLFGGTGDETGTALDKFRATLDAAKAKAKEVQDAVKKLIDAKVGDGFLKNLLNSGNTELIVQLAGAPDIASLAQTYQAVIKENDETGRLVAEQVVGARLDVVNQNIKELTQQLADRDQRDREEKKKPVSVKLTYEQVDRLSRGREIQLDLDAWNGNGGRKAS